VFASHLTSRAGGGPCCDPIVNDHNGALVERETGPVTAVCRSFAFYLAGLSVDDGCKFAFGEPCLAHDIVIENAHTAFAHRAHRELWLPGHAKLADDDDVKWCPEGAGNFGSNGHTTPGQAEHDNVFAVPPVEGRSKSMSGVAPVDELWLLPQPRHENTSLGGT
jgi:hypothetical protein